MKQKIDKLWIGALIGAIIPLIIFIVLYFQQGIADSFFTFISNLFKQRLLSAFLRIGLIGNLAIFLLAFNLHQDRLPKGILLTEGGLSPTLPNHGRVGAGPIFAVAKFGLTHRPCYLAVADARSSETPGPMVDASDTFFR